MTSQSSQNFESYVPVYDTVPQKWEEARPFLIEHLKKITNSLNIKEIGWYLEEELLSGKAFTPGTNSPGGDNTEQYRQIFRIVVDVSPLAIGVNTIPHGVTFDANLTSIDSWVEATNSTTFTAVTFCYPEFQIIGANIQITSPAAFDRAFCVWEFTKEL